MLEEFKKELRMKESECLICGILIQFWQMRQHLYSCHKQELRIVGITIFCALAIITGFILVWFVQRTQ